MVFATGLIALINPLASLTLYHSMVSSYPAPLQRRIAIRAAAVALAFMWLVVWCGDYLLAGLQIEVAAMQTAGGIIIMRIALDMMHPHSKFMPRDEREQAEEEPWNMVAVVPIAIPLTVGGGTFAYITASAAELDNATGAPALSAACAVLAAIIGATYYFARQIMDTLGPIGTRIFARMAGVVLLAIAMQLTATGLRGLLPGLAD